VRKLAANDFRDGLAGRRNRILCILALTLAATTAWPQELAKDELSKAADRAFSFTSFHGPQSITQSADEIVGIGEVLGKAIRAGGARGSYFGKYEAIRVFDPSQTRLLGADIIVFNAGAQVNTVDNVQRIVTGYLETAFGFSPVDAARLSALVAKYNAAHRGDIAYLSQKYSPSVMSHLNAENAGLALNYAEWPGKTRLLIPLGHAANGQPSVGGTPGQAGEAVTPGQTGEAATTRPASGSERSGPTAGNAGAKGVPASPGAAGGAGFPGGTTGGGTGTEKSQPEGGSVPPASPSSAGQPASSASSESQGVPSRSAIPGAGPKEPGAPGRFLPTTNLRWLLLLLLAAVVILVVLVVRILRAGLSPAWALEVLRSAKEGHPLVEMVVVTQNRHIGMRNVHYLPPGAAATVGGGHSTFLVYFVPVPRGIAILTYDGNSYSFVPRNHELFPSLTGPLTDCLGKEIPAKSIQGYPFTIVFRPFVSPLEEINKLMRSIRVPR
jgi:Borrelia P83/100 protein